MKHKLQIIDISKWQPDNILDTLHKKLDGVIIRAGHGLKVDPKLELFYNKAKEYGLLVGFYWYYDSLSYEGIMNETRFFLETVRGMTCSLPLCMDPEIQAKMRDPNSAIQDAGELIEKAGYFAMLYSNKNYIRNVWDEDTKKRFAFWVADWGKKDYNFQGYGCTCYMIQTSSTGGDLCKINVDTDIALLELPQYVGTVNTPAKEFVTMEEICEILMNSKDGVVNTLTYQRTGSQFTLL